MADRNGAFRKGLGRTIVRWELFRLYLDGRLLPPALRRWRIHRARRTGKSTSKGEGCPRLFVDVSVIRSNDAGTGIQRVVRALALTLVEQAPCSWELHFVAGTRKRPYHCISWPTPAAIPDLTAIEGRPGDVFLGLDYALDTVRWRRRQLTDFRKKGGELWFFIHDLLPLRRPDWFSRATVLRYRKWIEILASLADGFLCNSDQTETELVEALAELYDLSRVYATQVVPMGHDIGESIHKGGRTHPCEQRLRQALHVPFVLMVGTLEPRKGHADVLNAFDQLWRQGSEQSLVLIGRLGWRVEKLRDKITSHPEFGRKLLWFDDVDDPELIAAYRASRGVIIASYGEGFGLPLVEALGHGKAVLARDLPIFRSHEQSGVHYFPANATPEMLGSVIEQWLAALHRGEVIVAPAGARWSQAAQVMLAALSDREPRFT